MSYSLLEVENNNILFEISKHFTKSTKKQILILKTVQFRIRRR
nr:MAG TPA: hypothetical protein [Caudoviricetes sp.]